MTAHSTFTLHPWPCTNGHDTWARTRPDRCGHCVNGKPCDGEITTTTKGSK